MGKSTFPLTTFPLKFPSPNDGSPNDGSPNDVFPKFRLICIAKVGVSLPRVNSDKVPMCVPSTRFEASTI
jgi:hypothetical protein